MAVTGVPNIDAVKNEVYSDWHGASSYSLYLEKRNRSDSELFLWTMACNIPSSSSDHPTSNGRNEAKGWAQSVAFLAPLA